jgi:hypothetical protein
VSLVAGRKRTDELIRMIPGVPEALAADPTITDLSWLGDHVSVHYCDADAILEIDPTRLRSLDLLGRPPVTTQLFVSSALIKLYQVPIGEVNKLADSKYGVTYFGPDGGEYLTQHHGSYRFLKFRWN